MKRGVGHRVARGGLTLRGGGRHGFSLIELLVVMAIIAILVSLLFTLVNRMRNQARRARASNEVMQIAVAWNAYLEDYREYPMIGGSPLTEMNAASIGILRGGNPRGLRYLDFRAATTEYLDPWGHVYQFALDYDRDNEVPDQGHPHRGTIPETRASVLAWSWGNHEGEEDATPNTMVYSTR